MTIIIQEIYKSNDHMTRILDNLFMQSQETNPSIRAQPSDSLTYAATK